MQHLALIFLLAITSSMMFAYQLPALAQENTENQSDQTSENQTSNEDTSNEQISDEQITQDKTMEIQTMEEHIDSPLKQMLTGIDPHEVQCKTGQKLVFKASNLRPACINESSYEILLTRGWVSSHDPSHEDLMKMKADYMAANPPPQNEEESKDVAVNEDMNIKEETNQNNSTEAKPSNYTVNLSESMEMGTK